MRIVYCIPQMHHPGGIERIVSTKANYFADRMGWDVFIIASQQKGKPAYYQLSSKVKLVDLAIDYESTLILPIYRRIWLKLILQHRHKKLLTKLLNDIKPDITISTFNNEAAFLPQIKDGSKKILEFHFARGYKKILARVFKVSFLTRMAYYISTLNDEYRIIPRFDQFVVLTREDLEAWKPRIKDVINIPNIAEIQDSVPVSLHSKHAIAVGRLDAQKSFDRLVDIWAKVNSQHPDWILDIYGEGKDEVLLRDKITQLGLSTKIILHEATPNIFDKYRDSSMLLMTSTFEGWGLILSEAMSFGLPTVAYSCKCGPRDIIKNGEDGFCVPDGDQEMFVEKIDYLIMNPDRRKSFGEAAVKNMKRYSIDNVMPQWVSLFERLTNQ